MKLPKYANVGPRQIQLPEKFGRLMAIEIAYPTERGEAHFLCRCECGKEKLIRSDHLMSGKIVSCGCRIDEHGIRRWRSIHGQSHTGDGKPSALYSRWKFIRTRCTDKRPEVAKNYANRHIVVCDEWMEFKPFMDWALSSGFREDLQIDRIDNDGPYAPWNCRWVTCKENNNNKRTCRYFMVRGVKMNVTQIAEMLGVSKAFLKYRFDTRPSDKVLRELGLSDELGVML